VIVILIGNSWTLLIIFLWLFPNTFKNPFNLGAILIVWPRAWHKNDKGIEKDIASITKHFQSFISNNHGKKIFSNYKKDWNKELSRCYKCNKMGHTKVGYPLLQNKNKNITIRGQWKLHGVMIWTQVKVMKKSMW